MQEIERSTRISQDLNIRAGLIFTQYENGQVNPRGKLNAVWQTEHTSSYLDWDRPHVVSSSSMLIRKFYTSPGGLRIKSLRSLNRNLGRAVLDLEEVQNLRHRFRHAEQVRAQFDFRIDGRFVGSGNPGELLDLIGAGLGIKALGLALLADFARRVD